MDWAGLISIYGTERVGLGSKGVLGALNGLKPYLRKTRVRITGTFS